MAILLLGYALGLKEKIKQVMRSFLVVVSIYILVNALQPTYAQTITGEMASGDIATGVQITLVAHPNVTMVALDTTSPVTYYISKLLRLETKWSTNDAFSSDNKKLYTALWDQLKVTEPEEHVSLLADVIASIKQSKKTSLAVSITVLEKIYDIAKDGIQKEEMKDNNQDEDEETINHIKTNDLYLWKTIRDGTGDYVILTLHHTGTLKMGTFHLQDGTTYSCLYSQCDRILFNEDSAPERLYYTFGNGVEGYMNQFDTPNHFSAEDPVADRIIASDETMPTVAPVTFETSSFTAITPTEETTTDDTEAAGALDELESELAGLFGLE